MKSRVRILNESGVDEFRTYLDGLARGNATSPPVSLLTSPKSSRALSAEATIDARRTFKDRLVFGQYLAERLAPLQADPSTDANVGLWSWLALAFFDVICPPDAEGVRRPLAVHRYILSNEYKVYHRHLVRTPCLLYRLHGKHAAALLAGATDIHGEASEQILGRQSLLHNSGLFAALDSLYVIRRGGATGGCQLKPGARSRGAGGTMRRLGKIARQFDLTFDLYSMSGEQIVELLPSEFNRFRRSMIG